MYAGLAILVILGPKGSLGVAIISARKVLGPLCIRTERFCKCTNEIGDSQMLAEELRLGMKFIKENCPDEDENLTQLTWILEHIHNDSPIAGWQRGGVACLDVDCFCCGQWTERSPGGP